VRGRRDAEIARELVALGGPERQALVAVDHVAGADLLLDRRLRPGADAGAEHRHDRHEREPDHERGRGRRGPAGLRTALAPASSPATPPARRAGQPTMRAIGFTRRGASSAMPANRTEHADAEQQRHESGADPVGELRREDRRERRRQHDHSGLGRMRLELRLRQRRALADRRDRRDAGRAPRRQDAGEKRDTGPTISDVVIVCVAMTVPASGSSTPMALNSATMPLAIPRPMTSPITEASSRSRSPRDAPSA
jgi:hypothetical protein